MSEQIVDCFACLYQVLDGKRHGNAAIRVIYRAGAFSGAGNDIEAADANRDVAAIINHSSQVYVETSAISRWITLGLG